MALNLPTPGGDDGTWGQILNDNLTTLDADKASRAEVTDVADAQAVDAQALRASMSRTGAYHATQADGLDAFVANNGLTVSGGYYAATTDGTLAKAIIPRWAGITRVSFRVKITKGIAGSQSFVGLQSGGPGELSSSWVFGFGYKQGVGLGRVSAGNITAAQVADADLTDGDEYDVSLIIDAAMTPDNPGGEGGSEARVAIRWAKSDGTGAGWWFMPVNLSLFAPLASVAVATTVAAGGITALDFTAPVSGAVGALSGGQLYYGSTAPTEGVFMRMPAEPNGSAVIACHGHGADDISFAWTAANSAPLWDALEAAGYTVFCPDMGGDLWGNDTAQALLADLHGYIVDEWKFDPRVLLFGVSMGAGAALTAISQRRFPIRAAAVTDSVCDLSVFWDDPSFPTLPAAYNNDVAARDANNPILLPADSYAGVPILFSASPNDTVADKSLNTDPMIAHLGGAVETGLVATTGAHAANENIRPLDITQWLAAHA